MYRDLLIKRAFLLIAALLALLLLIDVSQLRVWQHDSAYYDLSSYFIKVKYEGRWMNPYLSIVFSKLNGHFNFFLCISAIFWFFFVSANRYLKNPSYAFVFAALCIQVSPLTNHLMWPALMVPVMALLMIASWAVNKLSIYVFYVVFGILLFATGSVAYYLLPLLHLPLLQKGSLSENLKFLLLKLLPAWAIGFIVGYIVMLLAVYLFTWYYYDAPQIGLTMRAWRLPNPIVDFSSFYENVSRSLSYLHAYADLFFESNWTYLIALIAIIIGFSTVKMSQGLPLALICLAIVIAHYVITIPVGIRISQRTVIATWVGISAFLFLVPNMHVRKEQIMMLLMVCLTTVFYLQNKERLDWMVTVSNQYYDDLAAAFNGNPSDYEGLLFLSDDLVIRNSQKGVMTHYGLSKIKDIEWIHSDTRWATVAFAANYKKVILCGRRDRRQQICKDIAANIKLVETPPGTSTINTTTTVVEGVFRNFVVARLHNNPGFM